MFSTELTEEEKEVLMEKWNDNNTKEVEMRIRSLRKQLFQCHKELKRKENRKKYYNTFNK